MYYMLPVSNTQIQNNFITSIPKSIPDLSETNYPKTLTILINTRIRGYPKLKYEPSMSVPNIKSDTVYFDPLVKLNSRITGTVPPGYPPSELYTQFFSKGSFESLLSRNLNSFFSLGQGKKTIEQATEDGYVDNNIKITLNQLFKSGSIFYINGKPFTIYNHDWNFGDWQIGTKNIQRVFETGAYGKGVNSLLQFQFSKEEEIAATQEFRNFENLHPTVLKGKINPNYSRFSDSGLLLTGVGQGLKSSPSLSLSTNVQTSELLQAALPSSAVKLLGRDYVSEPALNLDLNTPSIHNDPISISILYNLDRIYSEEIQKNKNADLTRLFELFLKSLEENKASFEKFNILLGIENKNPENIQTNKKENIDLRNELLKNKEKQIQILEIYTTANKTTNRYDEIINKLNERIEQIETNNPPPQRIPGGFAIADVAQPNVLISQINDLIDSVLKKNNELKIKISELNNLSQITNPNEQLISQVLPNQIKQLKLLQEIFQIRNTIDAKNTEIDNILTYSNINYLPPPPANPPLIANNNRITEDEKQQIQLQLQQLKKLLLIQQNLCVQFETVLKKVNYDFLLPQNKETSVLLIKADIDKLMNELNG